MILQVGQRATPRLDLGAAFMQYMQNNNDFIGLNVFPIFGSQLMAAYFPAITRESMLRRATTKRAPGGKYNRDGFETVDIPFSCVENGLEGVVDDAKRNLYQSSFDAELVHTQILGRRLLIEQEVRIKTSVINTTVFTGTPFFKDNSGTPWTTVGTDVRSHVTFAREKVRSNCGMSPNALIITQNNLDALKVNTQITDAIKYTARLTDAEIINALADFFGIQKVLIAKAVYNGAKEGQTFAGSYIWDDNYVFLGVVSEDTSGSLTDPAIGRTILWQQDCPDNVHAESYREESSRGDVIRVRQFTQELMIDKYFGFLMKVR